MIKILSKVTLVAAVASLALAVSMTASEAAKKKRGAAGKPAACAPWTYKTDKCNNGLCTQVRCGPDGKWVPSMLMCWQPFCPK
jgi:uncharacterized low-complexity protein